MNLLKNIPDGMYYYEYVLLLLGVVLFFVLLIILIILTIQKRSFKTLLSAFIFPILMIGYPGFQKISYDKGIVTIEKNSKLLAENPQDTVAIKELKASLDKVEDRPSTNSQTLVNIGKGFATIGDTVKAISIVDKAVEVDSGIREAKNLKTLWNTTGVRIEKLTKEVENNPSNVQAKNELMNEISIAEKSNKLNDNLSMRIVNASVAVRDTNRVLKYVDSLKINNPTQLQHINKIKQQFKR